jgi:hypothetical protein
MNDRLVEQTMDAAELRFWRERARLQMDECQFLTGLPLRQVVADIRSEAARALEDWPKPPHRGRTD